MSTPSVREGNITELSLTFSYSTIKYFKYIVFDYETLILMSFHSIIMHEDKFTNLSIFPIVFKMHLNHAKIISFDKII